MTAGTTVAGITQTSSSPNVFNNKIYNIQSTSAASPVVSGIAVTGLGASGEANIYNNLIGDLRTPNANTSSSISPSIRAINITSTTAGSILNLSFNTIFLNATSSGTNFGTTGIWATASPVASTSVLNLRNNIIVNLSTPNGFGKTVALQRSSTALNNYGSISNNNLFYTGTPSGMRLIFYDGTNEDQTLSALKARVTPADANSVTESPSFLSTSGASLDFLHINSVVPTQVESSAIYISSITGDYSGDIRAANAGYMGVGVAPDIGADEGDFTLLDISGPAISYTPLFNTCSINDVTINSVSITDATGIPLAGSLRPRIYYRKNAGSWFSQPGIFVSGTANNSLWQFVILVADIGGLSIGDDLYYYVVAQDTTTPININSFPTGVLASDVNTITNPPANPFVFQAVGTLNGEYIVGTGGAFSTLTEAVAAFNTNCLGGPVVFSLQDASYPSETFPIVIGTNPFSNATNTLTIRPGPGNTATINGSSSTSILEFNGADWVVIDGSNSGSTDRNLNIENTSIANNTAAIWIKSIGNGQGATNNTIKNINIKSGEIGSTVSINTFGIHIGGTAIANTAIGSDNDNLIIQNNNISKARYGIYARAASLANAIDGLQIIENEIGSDEPAKYVTFRGLDIAYATAPVVSRNTIFNIKQALSATNSAMDFGSGVNDAQITRNNIRGVYSESTAGWGAYGIHFSSTTSVNNNLIANNFISDIRTVNYSSGNTTFNAFGIRLAGGTNTKIYSNSVNLFGDITIVSGTPTQPTSANLLIASNTVTGLEIRNNIFRNAMTFLSGSPKIYNIWSSVVGYTFLAIDNNDYYGTNAPPGNSTVYHIGRIGTTDYTSLTNWKNYTGQDINSLGVPPIFVSETDLHAKNPALNGAAAAIAAISTDFDGEPRNAATPDIGADEFSIICPDDMTVSTDSGLCSAQINGIDGLTIDCPGEMLFYSLNGATSGNGSGGASGLTFEKGVTTVTYTATCTNGNTSSCSFQIQVYDQEAPNVICPADVTVSLSADSCVVEVMDIQAVYSDNCPDLQLLYNTSGATLSGDISGQAIGQEFNRGETI
ncbi:MAG: HYR domain-containing protein [Lewinellaceae bacterium]|nr:HYR domain-containing protein [Lewinellaceae bacterium]